MSWAPVLAVRGGDKFGQAADWGRRGTTVGACIIGEKESSSVPSIDIKSTERKVCAAPTRAAYFAFTVVVSSVLEALSLPLARSQGLGLLLYLGVRHFLPMCSLFCNYR